MAYGGGKFVGSGSYGLLATSTNGADWFLPDSGTSNHLGAPVYTGRQFVCVGSAGTILTSRDGLDWTPRASGTKGSLSSAAYGNGAIVAVGGDFIGDLETQVIVRSVNDGETWEVIRDGEGACLYRVAFGADRFLILTLSGDKMLTSTDGSTWQTQDTSFNTPTSLFYAGTNFIALGSVRDPDGPHIWTSPDGAAWRDWRVPEAGAGLGCAAFGAGAYVVTGFIPGESHYDWIRGISWRDPDRSLILTSADGYAWRKEESLNPIVYFLSYGQGTFVASAVVPTNAPGVYQTGVLIPRFTRDLEKEATSFRAEIISEPGKAFRVEASGDFKSWTTVFEAVNPSERTGWAEVAPPADRRFYRVVPWDAK